MFTKTDSLKILSPSANHLEPRFGDELQVATPKTRGITLLKKTSSQYTNEEFTKRLSIPSFHIADQILMDLLTEQNNNNSAKMNTIDESEIDDDNNNMDILQFMAEDDDDDDEYDDDEYDSQMTLDAFPDLPDINQPTTTLTQSLSANTPNNLTDCDVSDVSDDYNDDELLTPTTYNKLFNRFHNNTQEKEEKEEKELQSTGKMKMKINISEFKSDYIYDKSYDKSEFKSEFGFSVLQKQISTNGRDSFEIENHSIENAKENTMLVAKELMNTEILYQNHLINLEYILLSPIVDTYFGNDCISSIFYKFLCEIITVSKSFTMRLEIYVKNYNIPQLANWIYFICKRFSIYAHYAKIYDVFLDRLYLCKDLDDNIEYWLKRQEKRYKLQLNNQKFHSLCSMPIQRLPRYILLLEELIKHYIVDDGTILFLELAKSEIQTVSQRVNEMVRQRENRSNLRELINRFTGEAKSKLLRSNRVLVYEGFLYKVRKYRIKYYFHLFSDILCYSKINNNGLFNIHRIIDLHKIAIIDLPNIIPHSQKLKLKKKYNKQKIWYRFLLKSQEKSFEILTENEQEKQNWLLLIEAAISRLNTNAKNNTKSPKVIEATTPQSQSIKSIDDDYDEYYAPYWVPDDASNNCYVCNNEFTVINRRHHCRKCGNLICKGCSKNKLLLTYIQKNKPVKICDTCYKEGISNQQNQQLDILVLNNNYNNTPNNILKFIGEYKEHVRIILEHLCRPLMDVVENNKIITDFITSKKFYNKSNIIMNEKNEHNKNDKNDKNKRYNNSKKNKKKQLRKKKKKKVLEKNKKNNLNITDIKGKTILINLYKYRSGYKTLISLCFILEQIYDYVLYLHSELKLIIFKKQMESGDDMILDFYDDVIFDDNDNARIGRLFIMYTDLFNLHIEYSCRYNECLALINNSNNKNNNENYLFDFINKNVKVSLNKLLQKSYTLSNLLQSPLHFTRKIYEYLNKIENQIEHNSLVNSSDLDLCIKKLKQLLVDLDKEKTGSTQRIKLQKLEAQFDYTIDFRQRGRTLVISDFIIKTTKSSINTNHNYYFHLFSDILCYSNKKLSNNKFTLKKYIYLSNMNVIDGYVYIQNNKKNKKKNKKRNQKNKKMITIQYYDNIIFNNNNNNNNNIEIDIINEDNEHENRNENKNQNQNENTNNEKMKSFSLIFDSKEKKQTWYELLKNLIDEEKSKYISIDENKNNFQNKNKHGKHLRSYSGSMSSMKRYSATIGKEYEFCGICHSSFNRLFNIQYKCIKCDLPLCDACSIDKFYLNKKIIAPKYLKLCIRCNYHNHNERSCNILCV